MSSWTALFSPNAPLSSSEWPSSTPSNWAASKPSTIPKPQVPSPGPASNIRSGRTAPTKSGASPQEDAPPLKIAVENRLPFEYLAHVLVDLSVGDTKRHGLVTITTPAPAPHRWLTTGFQISNFLLVRAAARFFSGVPHPHLLGVRGPDCLSVSVQTCFRPKGYMFTLYFFENPRPARGLVDAPSTRS
jgi:hypothetical protein